MTKTTTPLEIAPGFYTESTDRGARGRWKDGNKVRFQNGLPEKLGGWVTSKSAGAAIQFTGKTRAIHDWVALDGTRYAAFGTHKKLYLVSNAVKYDITPIRSSGTLANNPFTTTSGLTTVAVTHVAHGASAGDYVTYSGASTFNGVTITGEYSITSITDADHYVITHSVAASGTGAGGGAAVTYAYQISIGSEYSSSALGFGYGGFGLDSGYGGSGYGTARTSEVTTVEARIWSLDNWGEDLMATYQDGRIYTWDKTNGPTTRAILVTNSPTTNRRILVSTEDRHLVSFGAHDGSASDPMLVRWTTQEDFTDWTPTATNSAGDKRLDHGSRIIGAIKSRNDIIIFTDKALYAMRFVGGNDVFGFTPLGASVAMDGPNAAIDINGNIFFKGPRDFYAYDGAIRPMSCDVRSYVFNDINKTQSRQVYAAVNRLKSEVMWLYPSASSQELDRYVIFNYAEKLWYYGTMDRTAFADTSPFYDLPYAVDASGYLYKHELGTDDNTSAMTAYVESYDVEIGNGTNMMEIDEAIPDFDSLTGDVAVLFKGRRYPQATQYENGPFTVTSSTERFNPRMKARQIAIRVTSDSVGDAWRMGPWRLRTMPHGKR